MRLTYVYATAYATPAKRGRVVVAYAVLRHISTTPRDGIAYA